MTLKLRPHQNQLVDLKRIAELGAEQLSVVRERLQSRSKPTLGSKELLDAVADVLPDEAELLVRQLLSLRGLVRQTGQEVASVMAGVRDAIERQGSDVELSVEAWSGVESTVSLLVEEQSVRLAATAIELAYDYANLLRRTKILTDIRPLYDETATHIEGAVVSYTLRIHYDSAGTEHESSIALDEADVRTLLDQCQRALTKAATASAMLANKCDIAVTVSGSPSDD